jgi:hypothetical protein
MHDSFDTIFVPSLVFARYCASIYGVPAPTPGVAENHGPGGCVSPVRLAPLSQRIPQCLCRMLQRTQHDVVGECAMKQGMGRE